MTASFRIVTVCNDTGQYAAMKASFLQAGFDEQRCRYEIKDNTRGNRYEPYRLIDSLGEDRSVPYVILCHQDVRVNAGSTCEQLLARLDGLTSRDDRWAVAGTAGVDAAGERVLCLDDPYGSFRHDDLPRRVYSLDENFLVFRSARAVRLSAELSGFHLYGTDACLQAHRAGSTAYVIEFPVTHLSSGNTESDGFQSAYSRFADVWRKRLLVGLIRTTCAEVRVSRVPWIERVLRINRVARAVWAINLPIV